MDHHISTPECPFCGFQPREGEDELILHIETNHPEGESPSDVAEETFSCPNDDCGELLTEDEMAYHLQLHELEGRDGVADVSEQAQPATPETEVRESTRRPSHDDSHRRRREKRSAASIAWKAIFSGPKSRQSKDSSYRKSHKSKGLAFSKPDSGEPSSSAESGGRSRQFARLGKSELGRFAHEKEMPTWLVRLLKEEGQVINTGIMDVLRQLLEQCPSTQVAYLCHSEVQHISKLRREGGFCGYRNTQMLISHIIGAKTTGANAFGSTFPSIFQIQDLIENAWDMGFNSQGRTETGGIKGTRKYIGTPEVQAVFCSLSIPCSVQAFKNKERSKTKASFLGAIERYFESGVVDVEERVHLTSLPPIYLQHPGHSLTIVGFERQVDGEVNLLVFDPSFRDSVKINQLVGTVFRHRTSKVDDAVQPYRRGSHYLRRYNAFEVLYLTPSTPAA